MFVIRSSRGYIQALDASTTPATIRWGANSKTALSFEDEKTAKALYTQAFKAALSHAKAQRSADAKQGGRKIKISFGPSSAFSNFISSHGVYTSFCNLKLKQLKTPALSVYNPAARRSAYKTIVKWGRSWIDNFNPDDHDNTTFVQLLKDYSHVFVTMPLRYYFDQPSVSRIRIHQVKDALDIVKQDAPAQAFIVRHTNGFICKSSSSGTSPATRHNFFNARLFSSYELASKAAERHHNAIVLTIDLTIKDVRLEGKYKNKVNPKISEQYTHLLALVERQRLELMMQQSHVQRLLEKEQSEHPVEAKKVRSL